MRLADKGKLGKSGVGSNLHKLRSKTSPIVSETVPLVNQNFSDQVTKDLAKLLFNLPVISDRLGQTILSGLTQLLLETPASCWLPPGWRCSRLRKS